MSAAETRDRLSWAVVRAVARRPALWPSAAAQVARLARPRWWAHAPFLPLPDPDYVRFRLETQYGADASADRIAPGDLVAYLEWCREVGRLSRGRTATGERTSREASGTSRHPAPKAP